METVFTLGKPFVVLTSLATLVTILAVTRHAVGQDKDKMAPLVMRVALFPADQDRPDKYQPFVGDLFRTLQDVHGYVGTFLGRDPHTGQMVSVSFWHSEADAVAGEEAVGRRILALPPGSAPRPSTVTKYVVEYRDIKGEFAK
jgi:hypothetical protein